MHFELKPISVQSIHQALEKVERYRLLNEPALAESVCLDILAAVPDHQQALISLLLSRTDQFRDNVQPKGALEILPQIKGQYEQAYYEGVIWERLGHARSREGQRAALSSAYQSFQDAMTYYEKAMSLAPAGNDDAILRWNTCARTIMQNPQIQPSTDNDVHARWHDEVDSRIADA